MIIMGDNTLGTRFKISSFGESHGKVIGVLVDGTPAGLNLDLSFIQHELDKRKPGQSHLTSARKESDEVEVLSGIFNDKTTGAPICLVIKNQSYDSTKYDKFKEFLRPSHVDYVLLKKYGGFADYRGSGRFSGRITAGFVMAGAIAKLILNKFNIFTFAYTESIGKIADPTEYFADDIEQLIEVRDKSPVKALNAELSIKMENEIESVKNLKDSIGGSIKCVAKSIPPGIGGPVFNSLEAKISRAIFAIPAIKGIEFGAGFKAMNMRGSEHNDPWIIKNGEVKTLKNDSGGIIGGISTGMPLTLRVAIKPTASIGMPQKTVNIRTMKETEFELEGDHDPCIVPRAVVVVESMLAIVILDQLLIEGFIPTVLNS